MSNFRFLTLLLFIAVSFGHAQAQTPPPSPPPPAAPLPPAKNPDAEKQQLALLDSIGKDAEALRLAENRALAAIRLAEGFWRYDEKRARELFQIAVSELVNAQTQAETNRKQAGMLYGLINGTSPRQEILTAIAARDAELALESFYKTRPAKITNILMNPEEMKKPNSQQFVQNEIYFEQSLISRVSEQNPQRSLKLIRESMAKGVTYEAINLVDRLKIKDPDLAAQFAGEVADKLLTLDFDKQNQDFGIATSFVMQFGGKPAEGEKPLKIDERKLRDLANRVIGSILKFGEDEYYDFESIIPIAERFSPENVAVLKRRQAALENSPDRREYALYEKFMETEPSPEKILAEADKFSESFRSQMYFAAAEKSAKNGNVAQAQKIITSKMSQEETENYLTQLNYGLISEAMAAERFDEAVLLINQIPAESSRISFLVQLATSIYRKNPTENKKSAISVLEQARALVDQPTENLEDMSSLMQIALIFAEIEPDQAFSIIESMSPQVNEYIEASAIVSKYRNDGMMRQGEMVINSYGGVAGMYNLSSVMTTLKAKDFKRTVQFVNSFQRPEVRITLLLQIVDTSLPETPSGTAPMIKTGG